MAVKQFRASVRQEAGLAILDLYGDLDGQAEDVLESAYSEAEAQDPLAVLLNLSQVTYINSKGIALIVVLLRRASRSGRRLLVCGLNEHYRKIFRITHLSDYILVCTDEQSAVAEIQSQTVVLSSPSG